MQTEKRKEDKKRFNEITSECELEPKYKEQKVEKKKKKKVERYVYTKIFNDKEEQVQLPKELKNKVVQTIQGFIYRTDIKNSRDVQYHLFLTVDGKVFQTIRSDFDIDSEIPTNVVKNIKEIRFPDENIKIRKIFSCRRIVFCVSDENKIYGWGENKPRWDFRRQKRLALEGIDVNRIVEYPLVEQLDIFCNVDTENSKIIDISFLTEAVIFFLFDNGNVFGFGANGNGELGIGLSGRAYHSRPVQLIALIDKKICKIQSGGDFSMALSKTGTVYSWGMNRFAVLAREEKIWIDTNKMLYRSEPFNIPFPCLTNVRDIAACHCGSLFLMKSGEILASGVFIYTEKVDSKPKPLFSIKEKITRFHLSFFTYRIKILVESVKRNFYCYSNADPLDFIVMRKTDDKEIGVITSMPILKNQRVLNFVNFPLNENQFILTSIQPSISFVIQLKRKDFLDIKFQYK